ncbi:MAG: J domain-containing protein [Sphingomicrobium sp.]
MGADQSAYSLLGLQPGADAAAVERAYKTLIKEHHPDRAGGDSARAAEINRAYRELRSSLNMRDDFSLHPPAPPRRKVGWSRTVWAAALVLLFASAAISLSLLAPADVRGLAASPSPALDHSISRAEVMGQPLTISMIDEAVLKAVRLSRTADEMALAAESRKCHRGLRNSPALGQFDRCAAFDDAVIRLQDRDPWRDKGAFSEIAVTGRLFSAAAPLSGDYLATDSRLRQIKVRVELLLTSPER